ncbi:MAG: hypothetical protein KDA05_00820 [Phycisphaerales bacterium]|nr:hypothetical protein [Phycisphaerales bacterium]
MSQKPTWAVAFVGVLAIALSCALIGSVVLLVFGTAPSRTSVGSPTPIPSASAAPRSRPDATASTNAWNRIRTADSRLASALESDPEAAILALVNDYSAIPRRGVDSRLLSFIDGHAAIWLEALDEWSRGRAIEEQVLRQTTDGMRLGRNIAHSDGNQPPDGGLVGGALFGLLAFGAADEAAQRERDVLHARLRVIANRLRTSYDQKAAIAEEMADRYGVAFPAAFEPSERQLARLVGLPEER